MILHGVVEVVHVSRVMPIVMDLHGFGVDMRLQRIIGIGQRIELERACGRLSKNEAWRKRCRRQTNAAENETATAGRHEHLPAGGAWASPVSKLSGPATPARLD